MDFNALRVPYLRIIPVGPQRIDGVVSRYGSLPLNQIIRYVYRRFPKMAEKSIHPEAQNLAHQV